MKRLISLGLVAVVVSFFAACAMTIPGMGGGATAYKPASAMNNQFTGDIASAKVGQYAAYTTEASGQKSTTTVKVVGTSGDNTWVEQWMDAGTMSYGYLFAVGKDGKIAKAYAAAKDEKAWTEIKVDEPPKAQAGQAADGPKPEIKESDEKKTTTAGDFASHRVDSTIKIQGKDYASTIWTSKDAPKLYSASDKGGLVAMEASGSKTELSAKGDDAKPTIELPAAK